MNYLERLVIAGGGGELFKPRLRIKSCLDVSPCRKLKKRRLGLCENHAKSQA